MDYKAFLKPPDPIVLPYFGGTRIDAADRRFALKGEPPAPGWWRFQIEGRRATPLEPASPSSGDLEGLPAIRGHWVDGWVVVSGRELGRIALPPEDEPQPLARVTARRWYSGDLLFDSLEFEDDAETSARTALEQRVPLGNVKGVVPSLRAAFGYALGLSAAQQLKIEISIRELSPIVVEIADGGLTVVRQLFDDLVQARLRAEALVRELAERTRLAKAAGNAKLIGRSKNPRERCDDALDSAAARMVGFRAISNGRQLEVTYTLEGVRIITTVDADTLQVIDPGICLANAHRVLTLDAMPSVVREAIEANHLNITRR